MKKKEMEIKGLEEALRLYGATGKPSKKKKWCVTDSVYGVGFIITYDYLVVAEGKPHIDTFGNARYVVNSYNLKNEDYFKMAKEIKKVDSQCVFL